MLRLADGDRGMAPSGIGGTKATVVADRCRPDGSGWVVMADAEGNEFCVERSAEERAAAPIPPS
jgi:hypothetical protein